MPRLSGAATPYWKRFQEGITKAVHKLGGDRAAEKKSGVNKSVWYDAKKGRAIPTPESTWPAMRKVLEGISESRTGVHDWERLYDAVRRETGRVARGQRATSKESSAGPSPADGSAESSLSDERRVFLTGHSKMATFALQSVSRLKLLSRWLDDTGAVAGQVVLIVGEGGLGKSVLLGQLADELASTDETGESRSASAVVLVACNLIPSSADLSTEEAADITFARAAQLPSPKHGLRQFVRELRNIHSAVYLLIDTLDMIVAEDTVQAITAVLADTAEDAQLFLTCRTREFENLLQDPLSHRPQLAHRQGDAVQMPKLGTEEILSWASSYVRTLDRSSQEKERFITSLSDAVSAATVREICAVPLRLALACDLYSDTGTVPADLTITGLYQSYWDKRISRDRHGWRTAQGEAQESAALSLAKAIWSQSTERLSLTVGATQLPTDAGMRALLSEDVIRKQDRRYEFFHQTYAEFAIALYLAEVGGDAELARLCSALQDPHSFLWPVARHLLLQRSADDRYRDLQAAVPQRTSEGALFHLLAAQTRESPELLVALAQTLSEHDPLLLQSLVPLLADAPASCAHAALKISVPMLKDIGSNLITKATHTVGTVLARTSASLRADYLPLALDLVARRKQELPWDTWLNLPENLIKAICSAGMDPDLEQLLHGRYAELGVCAQRVILRAGLTAPPSAVSDTASAKSPWRTLADAMLSVECPPEMSEDEPVELLRRCWETEEIRRDRGWGDWRDLLQADLPARWDSAQVRLVSELAREPGVRRNLLAAVLSDTPLQFRDRWINAAKFVAGNAPGEVVTCLLGLPTTLGREAVGSAATLSNQIAGGLGRSERERLIVALTRFEQVDPRVVWPALIVLAGPDVDLHRKLLELFAEVGLPDEDDGAETAESGKMWEVVRASVLDRWLHMAPTEFLTQSREDFRTLLPAAGGRATQRRAKFEGRIALHEDQAREWLRDQVLKGPSAVSARVGISAVKGAAETEQLSLTPSLVAWLLQVLPTRHTDAAQQITSILIDKELAPDFALAGATPEHAGIDHQVPDGEGDLSSAARTAAVARLESAVDSQEDTQLSLALIDLLVRLDNLRPLPARDVRRVINKMSEPVLGIAERLKESVTQQSKAEMTSDLNRWAYTIGALGLRRLPAAEVEGTVRQALVGWDSHHLGTQTVVKVLLGVLNHSPSPGFATWLVNELWPVTGLGTKLAIAEAIAMHERTTPSHNALALARRSDCPPEVAACIHRWLRS